MHKQITTRLLRNTTCRVRNCAFLVANVTKKFALATRISQLVASGRLTISCHDHYTNHNFDFQPNRKKINIQSRPPIGHLLFTLLLLLKDKTDFPVIINLSRFTARAVVEKKKIRRNAARLWPGASNMVIRRSS